MKKNISLALVIFLLHWPSIAVSDFLPPSLSRLTLCSCTCFGEPILFTPLELGGTPCEDITGASYYDDANITNMYLGIDLAYLCELKSCAPVGLAPRIPVPLVDPEQYELDL